MLAGVLLIIALAFTAQVKAQGACKDPTVEKRPMADDVRAASPFYVVALTKTPKTDQVDNVCYTYYETDGNAFFHIISLVYQNGSNAHYKFSKQDISDRMGLAQGTALNTSSCVYHDYTLVPVCNGTVFVLYRCFIEGECKDTDIDIGRIENIDVRVVLAVNPKISDACRQELEANLKDTSSLAGGDYNILPQNLKPQCITKYNNMTSLNSQNALGSISVGAEAENENRFGNDLDGELGLTSTPSPSLPKRTYAEVLKTPTAKKTNAGTGNTKKPCKLPRVRRNL